MHWRVIAGEAVEWKTVVRNQYLFANQQWIVARAAYNLPAKDQGKIKGKVAESCMNVTNFVKAGNVSWRDSVALIPFENCFPTLRRPLEELPISKQS